jgi:hypothetical protein
MKKICLLVCCVATQQILIAQNFSVNAFAGIANYQGDLQGKRISFNQSAPVFGIGANYQLTPKFSVRSGLNFAKIKAADVNNSTAKGIELRNLSFKTNITELQLGLEYDLFALEGKSITPYVFASVAYFHFNPYAIDSQGNKVYLKPLSTEGQGLAEYPDRKNYSLSQLAIPFGGGVKYQTNNGLQFAVELGLRKTFTDYLDDVSTNFVDQNILLAAKGAQAVAIAYRGDEVNPSAPYPADGAQRGSPKYKDWYYFAGLRVSKVLLNKDGMISKRSKKLACPVNRF